MSNTQLTSTFFVILILNAFDLVQWTSGESTSCTESHNSVTCEEAKGGFLSEIQGENIVAIAIVKSDMGYVSEEDFSKFTNVREVMIDKCKIPLDVIGCVLSPKELKVLKITNSNISENYFSVLKHSSSLEVLSLQDNNIAIITSRFFNDFAHLEEIDLSNNEISGIESDAFGGLSSLKKLNLSYNYLDFNEGSIPNGVFDNLPRVEEVNLRDNMISTIKTAAFGDPSPLRKLDLSYNYLEFNKTGIPKGVFDNLPRLEEIDLSHNKISTIDADAFGGLSALRRLDLSYNMLTSVYVRSIPKGVFDNLLRLEELDLSYNYILTIEADTFRGLSALMRLDLTENRLGEDFDLSSLSLPAGCVAQSLVATCPGAATDDRPPDEGQRSAQDATTDDPQQKTQQQQQPEADVRQEVQEVKELQQQQQRDVKLLLEKVNRLEELLQQQQSRSRRGEDGERGHTTTDASCRSCFVLVEMAAMGFLCCVMILVQIIIYFTRKCPNRQHADC